MRIVKWNPQERVDVPDITAMNFLMLGEFRRTVRGALGVESNGILKGFAVEPAAVPDSTIVVKLDNGGGDLSFAFGSEEIGTRTDYGQLIGGDNSDAKTEGNAQQTLDFIAQPSATYTVGMRFLYADGANDNRAFWNEGSDSEFIATVDTRHLPQFEIAINPVGDEWLTLADVVWDSGVGTISAGDITDLREGVFEGASPWQQTTRLGSGGLPDFSRASTARQDAGTNAVYPALKALGRQIQDFKGPDDSGNWNWWNNPYTPADPAGTLTADNATNLRSLRTAHFTVGDGVTTWGDFNGLALGTGLDACLSHIEASQGSPTLLGSHVIIQILVNGDNGVTEEEFQIGNYVFDRTLIEIRGGGTRSSTNGPNWHATRIECVGTLTTPAFDMNIYSGLVLRDLYFVSTGSDTRIARLDGQATRFGMHNCRLSCQSSDTTPWLEYDGVDVVEITNCDLIGTALITDATRITGEWRHCGINGEVRIIGGGNVTFTSCDFDYQGDLHGSIWASSAYGITFNNCQFESSTQEHDVVHFENSVGEFGGIRFQGCQFSCFETAPGHVPDAGSNGTNGTGWMIYLDNAGGSAINTGPVIVDNCQFNGSGNFGGGHIDAGGIYADDLDVLNITNCSFYTFGLHAGGTPRCSHIRVRSSVIGFPSDYHISGCTFWDWVDDSVVANDTTKHAIYLDDADSTIISNCKFNGSFAGVQVYLDNSDFSQVLGCNFKNSSTWAVEAAGSALCIVSNNVVFSGDAGFLFDATSTSAVITGNCIDGDNTTPNSLGGNGVVEVNGSGSVISDNRISNWNGVYNCIDLGANNMVMMGNLSVDGIIDANGTTGHVGYATSPNMNNVTGYL